MIQDMMRTVPSRASPQMMTTVASRTTPLMMNETMKTEFDHVPLLINNYVEYDSNNDIYSSKPADKMKAGVYRNCK